MDGKAPGWSLNPYARATVDPSLAWDDRGRALDFHRQLPGYAPTPLVSLPNLARRLGIARLWLKDESNRLGLNAFKVLGASYGVHRVLVQRAQAAGLPPPLPGQLTPSARERLGELVIVAATEGNHGRAVAWSAARLGLRAVIFMRQSAAPERVRACEREGATVVRVPGAYDDAVRAAAQACRQPGWELVSDTGFPGHEQVPRDIADGYRTLFVEVDQALAAQGEPPVSCVVIQAGVGGLASAAVLHYRTGRQPAPRLLVVEPREADCLLASIRAPGGRQTSSSGSGETVLAGLNCGTPSQVAWPLLREGVDAFLAIDDAPAREAVLLLAAGAGGDPVVKAGDSGAAGVGGLLELARTPAAREVVERCLGPQARVLVINSEAPLGGGDPG